MNPSETHLAHSLLEDLKNTDVRIKVKAVSSIFTVAQALGKEKTRQDLIPFLKEVINDEEDEVLHALGDQLVEMVEYVGEAHAVKLFDLVDKMLKVDDNGLRNHGVKVFKALIGKIKVDDHQDSIFNMVTSLIESDLVFVKVSGINLVPIVFNSVSINKRTHLISLISKLTFDPNPILRRETCKSIEVQL